MQPLEFEGMAQALLEKTYRIGGNLIQFGGGKDGGREATWTQPPDHPGYTRPANQNTDLPKEWVFQVKYHDSDQRGWSVARDAVIEDLEKELEKVHKNKLPCDAYVMITNVPFTGALNVGTRDKVTAIAKRWKRYIPDIFVWDAADLSRMLDANESVRVAYIDTILPGDTLKAIYKDANFRGDRRKSAFKAYLKYVIDQEGAARAEEAGDKPDPLPLAEVFIDLTLKIRNSKRERSIEWLKEENRLQDSSALLPENLMQVRASFALFFADEPYILLLGGPGLGKSTLTQFLTLYQAARTFTSNLALRLAGRLKLPDRVSCQDLDAYVRPRFPFRVELRSYARWISQQQKNQNTANEIEIARYISEVLINANTSSQLEMDDVFDLASKDPILLILDGLDEVPNPETRRQIIENLQIFLRRIDSEQGDIQVILSSRPKGYSGEFDGFEPLTWELNELDRSDFDEYCDQWLKKRIRDVDKRNEAKERISRGMMSEAVQRLARSLLQATVILTIVESKIEIPHQRHLLYKKYVEVIFNREKNKSLIVDKWEKELLRLHERVGYELHCKMEKTRIEALDRELFRSYVLNVLEDYSCAELGNKKLREVAQEIIDAAEDRLGLLVGKGKDQRGVDFVVQQFREYFAAVYLFNHPNADPDKVFAMLVRRGAYWAYVLQFYVAQVSPNQQLAWVRNIADQDDNENFVEAIIEATRTRRSVLNILPEFSLQQNNSLASILKIIFSKKTRWTWLEQESVIEILQLRSDFNRKILWTLFDNLSTEDKATLSVELWLLAKLSSSQPEDLTKLCNRIQNLLEREDTQDVALSVALQNDLKVRLTNYCSISELITVFEEHRYKQITKLPGQDHNNLQKLWSNQSKEKQCEMMLMRVGSWYDKSFTIITQKASKILFPEIELSFFNREIVLEISPYLCRDYEKLEVLNLLNNQLREIKGIYAEYLRHIVQALQDPKNSDLDNKTREIENQIREEISFNWRTESVLGPPVSAFHSVEKWEEFKEELSIISKGDSKWIAKISHLQEKPLFWTVLFFHPDHWPLLVEAEIIKEKEYQYLVNTPLSRLLKIPTIPLSIFESVAMVSSNIPDIPLHKILRVAFNIVESEGIERISKARALHGFLWRRKLQLVTREEVEKLLCQANSLPPLSCDWAGATLKLCLDTPTMNVDILLDFWEKNEKVKPRFIYFPDNELSEDHNQLLEKLLNSSRASALRLGIAIVAHGKPNKKIQNLLRDQLLAESSSYLNSEDTPYAFYQALFNLDPSLEEFSIWLKPEIVNSICNKPWILGQIRRRFSSATDSKYQLDHKQLQQHLSYCIIHRSKYPETVVLGALEAILKIDEINLPPLDNTVWQQCLEDDEI